MIENIAIAIMVCIIVAAAIYAFRAEKKLVDTHKALEANSPMPDIEAINSMIHALHDIPDIVQRCEVLWQYAMVANRLVITTGITASMTWNAITEKLYGIDTYLRRLEAEAAEETLEALTDTNRIIH